VVLAVVVPFVVNVVLFPKFQLNWVDVPVGIPLVRVNVAKPFRDTESIKLTEQVGAEVTVMAVETLGVVHPEALLFPCKTTNRFHWLSMWLLAK